MSDIILKNISHSFDTTRVLDSVDITIKKGDFFTLLGPSGCGKTTLLRILAGFIRPTEGQVLIGDTDITEWAPEKRNMGIVFQNYALFPNMTVRENISYGLKIRRQSKAQIKEKCDYYMDLAGLKELEGRRINELSGGQQQRVAIARALAAAPAIILADEPTGNLDSKTSQDVLGLLKVTSQKFSQTIVMITHNEEIAQLADRIIRIEDGRIVNRG